MLINHISSKGTKATMSSESYGRFVDHLLLRSMSSGTHSLQRHLHHVTILLAVTICQKGYYQSMLIMKTSTCQKPVMDLAHPIEPDSWLLSLIQYIEIHTDLRKVGWSFSGLDGFHLG